MGQEVPLAFDLALEKKAIQISPDTAEARFHENVWFYLKEYYAGVPTVRYSYQVERLDGQLVLVSPNYQNPMREHYRQAALDRTKPVWFQKRCLIEYCTFCQLEKELSSAKPGDLFVWASPPPFEQSESETADFGFGKHSFVFVFRLNKETVDCFALRNYLDIQGLREFLENVSGQEITASTSDEILSSLVKARKSWTLSKIQEEIGRIYQNTPPERKIIPEDESFLLEQEANRILEDFEPWIKGVYYLLKLNAPHWLTAMEFHNLEREISKAFLGEEYSLPFPSEDDPFVWALSLLRVSWQPVVLPSVGEVPPFLRGGSCGFGSGFSSEGTQLINYQTAESSYQEKSEDYIVCPVCGKKVKKDLGVCPFCGTKLAF